MQTSEETASNLHTSPFSMGLRPCQVGCAIKDYPIPRTAIKWLTYLMFMMFAMTTGSVGAIIPGNALAPAILGSAMNMRYNSTLKSSLPAEVSQMADQATMTSLGNPRVLLNETAMESLRTTLNKTSSNGDAILHQTFASIRLSMEEGLRIVFIFGAVAILLTFLIICTIPEVSIETQGE